LKLTHLPQPTLCSVQAMHASGVRFPFKNPFGQNVTMPRSHFGLVGAPLVSAAGGKPRTTRLSNRSCCSGRRLSLDYLAMQTGTQTIKREKRELMTAEEIRAKYGPEEAEKIMANCQKTHINSRGEKVWEVLVQVTMEVRKLHAI